ncbi:MAG: glycoside hydrolase family 32 protein, partial [Promethearchaeota archaeon]
MEISIEKAMKSVIEGKKIAEKSPYRPKYHFIAPAYWMNDPNGTIFYKDEYHLFYQFNPYGSEWGNIHWGHAKSKDLVLWERLPIALAPSIDQGDRAEKHCFSGCCVINNGVPSIIYTKIGMDEDAKNNSEQWMATSKDNMLTWKKNSNNPIMTDKLHGDFEIKDWRDPYIWFENNKWYAVLGGHFKDKKRGSVFLYRSPDLNNWEYLHPLFEGTEAEGEGSNWECPNFFPLGKNKHMLVVSPGGKVIYSIGNYDKENHRFQANSWRILDHGKPFYATNTLIDRNGRLILFGWINFTYIFYTLNEPQGWNGCISLPRILSYKKQDELRIEPIPELSVLRQKHVKLEEIDLKNNEEITLDEISGTLLEIKTEIDILENFNTLEIVGFKLSGCENEIFMGYNVKDRKLQAGKASGIFKIKKEKH